MMTRPSSVVRPTKSSFVGLSRNCKEASCKVFGDHWHLRGGLLGAPQLCPLWVECNPGEDAQRLTTRRTPPPPRRLLTRSDALSAPVVHPATAQRLAGPLAAARIDARRPMRLAVRPPGRPG